MTSLSDDDEIDTKHLCFECTTEDYLSNEIRKKGTRAQCDYCEKTRRCYSLEQLADRVEQAFQDHYQRTSGQPTALQSMMLSDRESTYNWDRDGEATANAIMEAAEIPEKAAEAVQEILAERHSDMDSAAMGEETEFADDAHYEAKGADHSEWESEWQKFDNSLRTEGRFFNQSAIAHLAALFKDLQTFKTRSKTSVIINAGPGTDWTTLFRARMFQSDGELITALATPDRHLGPPPPRLAQAGRMNAGGITVFYGANSRAAAMAEVRPPVGCQIAVAPFEIIRPLRLLDLTAFDKLIASGSIFDPEFIQVLAKAAFLRTFGQRLSRPVMPNDQAFAYLATQAVADFLASEPTLKLDGLIFPAVQAAGDARNVVLFHKAVRVKPRDVPSGTKVSVRLYDEDDDGVYRNYTVTEEIPPAADPVPTPPSDEEWPGDFGETSDDLAPLRRSEWDDELEVTLEINVDKIEVHIVKAVEVKTEEHPVSWRRWEKIENTDF